MDGALIARLSRFMDEFVFAALDETVRLESPRSVLDVGCGTATHLVHLLHAIPSATGTGVETDHAAAGIARNAIAAEGLADRAEIVEAEVRHLLTEDPGRRFDLILHADMIYYVSVTLIATTGRCTARCAPRSRPQVGSGSGS